MRTMRLKLGNIVVNTQLLLLLDRSFKTCFSAFKCAYQIVVYNSILSWLIILSKRFGKFLI